MKRSSKYMARRDYWGSKREAGLESLVDWIDSVQSRSPNQRWGIWGGVVGGSSGLVGGSMATLATTWHMTPSNIAFWLPLIVWAGLGIGMTVWVLRKNGQDEGAWSQESRGVMNRIVMARWHGTLRRTLGEQESSTLNKAAGILLACRSSLDSPAWKAAAGGQVWSDIREKTLRSLDSAMARVLLLVTSGAPIMEADAILADMQSMHSEVQKAAARHASVSGVSQTGSEALRETLAEMRELAEADEEFLQDRIKS